MSIGIVGAGNMGRSIATQLAKTGERVLLADSVADKATDAVAEIAAGDGVSAAGIDEVVVDVSKPLDASWIRLATDPSTSSAELLTEALPQSRIVKAFNTTTAPVLSDGQVEGVPLDVFVAADDDGAKSRVSELVHAAGLRAIDAGRLDNARMLERLTAFQIELSQRRRSS